MADAAEPDAENAGGDVSAPHAPRRRHCDNCGARLRGRFCTRCGQRDIQYDRIVCENCGAEKQGLFCAVCGQNDRNYRRTIFPVVAEAVAETFETDSRLFATLKVLFTRPGFLSTEFSRNRRARYLSPFRLYLFTSIAFFFILSLSIDLPDGPPGAGDGPRPFPQGGAGDGPTRVDAQSDGNRADALRRARLRFNVDGGETGDDPADRADGPVAEGPWRPTPEQRAGVERFRAILDEQRQPKLDAIMTRPAISRAIASTAAEIGAETYARISPIGLYLVGQLVDVMHRPWDAAKAWLENLPVAMFCLLPVYALLLKILYVGHRRFYSEHLVFSMHIHTVAYLVFTVLAVMPDGVGADWLAPLLFLTLAVYYFLALKRYYDNGGFVTLLKFVLLSWLYSMLLIVALAGAAAAVLLFF